MTLLHSLLRCSSDRPKDTILIDSSVVDLTGVSAAFTEKLWQLDRRMS